MDLEDKALRIVYLFEKDEPCDLLRDWEQWDRETMQAIRVQSIRIRRGGEMVFAHHILGPAAEHGGAGKPPIYILHDWDGLHHYTVAEVQDEVERARFLYSQQPAEAPIVLKMSDGPEEDHGTIIDAEHPILKVIQNVN